MDIRKCTTLPFYCTPMRSIRAKYGADRASLKSPKLFRYFQESRQELTHLPRGGMQNPLKEYSCCYFGRGFPCWRVSKVVCLLFSLLSIFFVLMVLPGASCHITENIMALLAAGEDRIPGQVNTITLPSFRNPSLRESLDEAGGLSY